MKRIRSVNRGTEKYTSDNKEKNGISHKNSASRSENVLVNVGHSLLNYLDTVPLYSGIPISTHKSKR